MMVKRKTVWQVLEGILCAREQGDLWDYKSLI